MAKLKLRVALTDPLFMVSMFMALLGAVQTNWHYLKPLIDAYPAAFGLAMFVLSVGVAMLRFFSNQSLTDKALDKVVQQAGQQH